jgi:hypothetical protein
MFCLLDCMPRSQHLDIIKNSYKMLKPGGLIYIEDIAFKKHLANLGAKREDMERSHHLAESAAFWYNLRQYLICAGYEVLELLDVTREFSEGCWHLAESDHLAVLETHEDKLDPETDVYYMELFGKSQPRFLNDLRHLTSEEIRAKFPRTSKYTDPDVWVHGPNATFDDLCAYRIIGRKPLN